MGITHKAAVVALGTMALLGVGAGVASAAPTTPSPATTHGAQAQWSRGFDFYNTSTVPMTFTGQSWDTGHPLGTVVLPGRSMHFEVPYDGGLMEYSYVAFTPVTGHGATGQIRFTFLIEGVANTDTGFDGTYSGFQGAVPDSGVGTNKVYVVDPEGTDITLDGHTDSEAQPIATALHQLCDDATLATCQFDARNEDPHAWSAPHQVGISMVNHQDDPVVFKKLETDSVGISDSVGVSVTAGGQLFGLINTSVNASYLHNMTSSSTFTNEVDMPVDSGDTVWVLDAAPVIRDTGDFTITMGNTTYHLDNVSFDSPDGNRQGQWQTCSLHAKVQCSVRPDGTPGEL